MSEDLPLRTRGGTAIRYNFPADGEYMIKVRLRRDGDAVNGDGNVIRGVALKRQLDLRLDGARLKLFTVGGEHFGKAAAAQVGGLNCCLILRCRGFVQWRNKKNTNGHSGADAGLEVRIPSEGRTAYGWSRFRWWRTRRKPERAIDRGAF